MFSIQHDYCFEIHLNYFLFSVDYLYRSLDSVCSKNVEIILKHSRYHCFSLIQFFCHQHQCNFLKNCSIPSLIFLILSFQNSWKKIKNDCVGIRTLGLWNGSHGSTNCATTPAQQFFNGPSLSSLSFICGPFANKHYIF